MTPCTPTFSFSAAVQKQSVVSVFTDKNVYQFISGKMYNVCNTQSENCLKSLLLTRPLKCP